MIFIFGQTWKIICKKFSNIYHSKHLSIRVKLKCYLRQIFGMILYPFLLTLWYIDDLFFPNYKKVQIKNPIFIIGGFRTGTTILHRELEKTNENFVSPRFFEILCPFLTVQYVVYGIQKYFPNFIDSCILRICGPAILEKHFMSYNLAEEDDLLISLYFGIGWYNILQYPVLESWHYFANTFDEEEKIGAFYQKCMQKIIYKRGNQNSRLLAKSHLLQMIPIWKKLYPEKSVFISIERELNKSLESWMDLHERTTRQFFGFSFCSTVLEKHHEIFWRRFIEKFDTIDFDIRVQLEDYCDNPSVVLRRINDNLKITNT